MSPDSGVSVVLPAFNEENGVGDQVRAIRQALASAGLAHEVVVVDDGSVDRTAQRALDAGARVLQHDHNRGYGAALKSGILAARHEVVLLVDLVGIMTRPPSSSARRSTRTAGRYEER